MEKYTENTFKLLKYPNYFIFSVKQKTHKIFQKRRVNHSDKSNKSKYIFLPTNSITTTTEKNLSTININFVKANSSKTIKDLMENNAV